MITMMMSTGGDVWHLMMRSRMTDQHALVCLRRSRGRFSPVAFARWEPTPVRLVRANRAATRKTSANHKCSIASSDNLLVCFPG